MTDELEALGSLLDRTYAEIAAAAARPVELDRRHLVAICDIWDDHLVPAVSAAALPRRGRTGAAVAIWRSLGRTSARSWLDAHLREHGLDPALLGDDPRPWRPSRDYRGRLCPTDEALTVESGRTILADYEFTGGTVVSAVADTQYGGVTLAPRRRRYTDRQQTGGPGPRLVFSTGELVRITMPRADRAIRAEPVITPDRVGDLIGGRISCFPDDVLWPESAAARAAIPQDLPRREALAQGRLGRDLGALALLQREGLLQIRTMRYPALLRRRRMAAAGDLFAGLGSATLAAAGSGRRASAALLRSLVERSAGESRTFLAEAAKFTRLSVPDPGRASVPGKVEVTPANAAGLAEESVQVRYVQSLAGGALVLHLLTPDDRMVVATLSGLTGDEPLVATQDPPTGPATIAASTAGITLTLPSWTLHVAGATWYSD